MAGNTFGKLYKVTTFGESHGAAVGAVIDGCQSNIELSTDDIQIFLDRRKPSSSKLSTTRKETDKVEILSGVFEGKTLGTPICAIVRNVDTSDKEYEVLKNIYRPGHADYVYEKKYGIRDYRSGGRSSGRETIGRVIGGAVAAKILKKHNITFSSRGIYDISKLKEQCSGDDLSLAKDSIGGIVECIIKGVPVGVGEPVFEKLDAELSYAIMSIGSVKGVEIGIGFEAANILGSINNDEIIKGGKTRTNNAGGIVGGISNGEDIVIRAAIKPTPTIGKIQHTIDISDNEVTVELKGRNDICIVDRVVVVVESMAAMTILDYLLQKNCYNM